MAAAVLLASAILLGTGATIEAAACDLSGPDSGGNYLVICSGTQPEIKLYGRRRRHNFAGNISLYTLSSPLLPFFLPDGGIIIDTTGAQGYDINIGTLARTMSALTPKPSSTTPTGTV